MNNYVLMICKVSVVFYLIYLSEVSCKFCKKTIANLITINASSQNFKVFAMVFFCLSECNISETKRPIFMQFIFYYFQSLSKKFKYLSYPTRKWRCLREGIFAFNIIYCQFFQYKKYFKHTLYRIQEARYFFLETFPYFK